MYKSPEPENIKENCDLFIRRKNAQCDTLSTNDPYTCISSDQTDSIMEVYDTTLLVLQGDWGGVQ